MIITSKTLAQEVKAKHCPRALYKQTRRSAVVRKGRLHAGVGKPANDFRVMWKGLCDFLLVLNRNLGFVFHRLWNMASFLLKKRTFIFFSLHSTTNSKMFFLALHHLHSTYYTRSPGCIRYGQTDGRTTDRQTGRTIGPQNTVKPCDLIVNK